MATIEELSLQVDLLRQEVAAERYGMVISNNAQDVHWLLYAGTLVFLMQAGFAMLCAGSIRAKNASNIMLKNLLDACVGALGFWSTGYALAYGKGNKIYGRAQFFLSEGFDGEGNYHSWFFQFAFAATAATIVSGAVAERCKMEAYAGYSWLLTAFVYPIVVHWVWSDSGFLSAFRNDPILGVGVVDFAGCGVVHMVGGIAAGIGAWILGPRIGRFDGPAKPEEMRPHSIALVCLGTFLLWVGWYGFNPGSTLAIAGEGVANVASKTAVTTTLAAAAGGISNLTIHYWKSRDPIAKHGIYDVAEMCNGILAGLVSITSACAVVEPWAACVIGVIGAFVYTGFSIALEKLQIDDAVNATPVHFGAGIWGLLAPGFFARPENMRNAYGVDKGGIFYGGNGDMLACQVAGAVCIFLWVAGTMGPFFALMKYVGLFRVDAEDEITGLDDSKHGGAAYNIEMMTSSNHGAKVEPQSNYGKADEVTPANLPA